MGWWSATPKKSKQTRWQANGGGALPPVQLETVANWLAELGYVGQAMDLVPLSYVEIEAWAKLTAKPIDAWTVETLRLGSEAFIRGNNEGKKASSNPPWVDREASQAAASRRIAAGLAAFRNKPQN